MGYTVALTGGIGSGKSTVADAFAQLGVNVVDADIIARQVVEPGSQALSAITARFGAEMILSDGSLNRRALRERIFASPADKEWLNRLLHPLIHQQTQREIAQATSPYVLWVVPLLVENQLYHKADRFWWWMSRLRLKLHAPRSVMVLAANMQNIFLLLRPHAKRDLPSLMMLLTIMAHQVR